MQTFSRLHADWSGGLEFESGCHEFSDGIVDVLFGVLKVLLVLMATMGLVGGGSHTGCRWCGMVLLAWLFGVCA